MVIPCINDIKSVIVQVTHSNIVNHEIFKKKVKTIKAAPTCFSSRRNHH